MQLTGKQVLNANAHSVWHMLMDTDVLARIVPGVSRLDRIADNSYTSTIEIKLGPVGGSFTGNLQMDDIAEQKSFTLKTQQNSRIGNANASVKIELAPIDDHKTEVSFNGDVKLSGVLASMGQRVIGGVANTLTKQFFSNFEKEIKRLTEDAPVAPAIEGEERENP